MNFLFVFLLISTLVSCTKKEYRFLFQNGVGLNLDSAGCSILDLGGVGRMCERVRNEKPDLFFQVGPAFSPLVPKAELSADKIPELRKALVRIWNESAVTFYSVDGLDLNPNLKSFETAVGLRKFEVLSTNLRSKEGKPPFKLFYKTSWREADFLFLSFMSPKGHTGSSDWKALSFKDSVEEIAEVLKETQRARLIVLGSLSATEREEIAKLIGRPAYFVGGTLDEENSTEWLAMDSGSFWGKAVDLGRGMGMIKWSSAPTMGLKTEFSSKGLRKDLDAVNQCTKIANEVLGSSR